MKTDETVTHSPGPWIVKKMDLGDEDSCIVPAGIVAADGFPVVAYEGGLAPDATWSRELLAANAHLIAAAPDLLEVCEMFDGFHGGGDMSCMQFTKRFGMPPDNIKTLDAMLVKLRAALAAAKGEK